MFVRDYPPTPTPTQHKKETFSLNGGTPNLARLHASPLVSTSKHLYKWNGKG